MIFWAIHDEIADECSIYQQWLGKGLTEKYGTLSTQMDQLVKDANVEIENCRRKIEGTKTTSLIWTWANAL